MRVLLRRGEGNGRFFFSCWVVVGEFMQVYEILYVVCHPIDASIKEAVLFKRRR